MSEGGVHPSREDLFAYRDGELHGEKRLLLEAHVMGCSVCRGLIDEVSGLESALRRARAEPGANYYETLPDAVLRRIGGVVVGEEGVREGGRRVGAAPRLPWAAILSTATAAAAVLVVVVVLVRHGAVRRALSPLPPPVSEKQATPPMQSRAPTLGAVAPADSLAATPPAPALPVPTSVAESREKSVPEAKTTPLAVRGEDLRSISAAEPYAAKDEERDLAKREALAQEPSEAYAALLRRFNLPPVWNERVSPETLGQAEPELRYIYQTGRAGSDSARVRLYLAEAARLRYVPGQDADLFEQISHHYWRAIRLSGADTAVARTARERLGTLGP